MTEREFYIKKKSCAIFDDCIPESPAPKESSAYPQRHVFVSCSLTVSLSYSSSQRTTATWFSRPGSTPCDYSTQHQAESGSGSSPSDGQVQSMVQEMNRKTAKRHTKTHSWVCYYLDWMRAPFPVPAGVVLRSLIGAQILVCKISPLVTVAITVTPRNKHKNQGGSRKAIKKKKDFYYWSN
jgi:hypothetical protein